MSTPHPDRLVADYLRRLEIAAAPLPASRRADLVAEIRAHIDEALRVDGVVDEIAVRNVLERLGPPEEIAAAAGPPPTVCAAGRRFGPLEIAALLALTVGSLVPIVGWVAGAVLVVLSAAWSTREKVTGLLLGLVAPVLGLLLSLLGSPQDGLGPTEVAVIGAFLAGLPSALYLAWRLLGRSSGDVAGPGSERDWTWSSAGGLG
jgi:hypothetical protein